MNIRKDQIPMGNGQSGMDALQLVGNVIKEFYNISDAQQLNEHRSEEEKQRNYEVAADVFRKLTGLPLPDSYGEHLTLANDAAMYHVHLAKKAGKARRKDEKAKRKEKK